MKFEKLKNDEIFIPPDSLVTVTQMGKVTEVQYMSRYNDSPRTEKLSNEEYVVLSTGEIKEYENKKTATKNESENSVRKTMRRIRQLVQTNVTDTRKVRWITLTYRENMTDTKRLYEDFRKFNQRFSYQLVTCGISKPEYIAVAEPQRRGAWHLHILYIWDTKAPYICNDEFAKLWGHGFTKVKALHDSDNIASYLLCYLTDIEIPSELKEYFSGDMLKEVGADNAKKSIVKGARLNMYPSNFNILRHSKNIKKPKKIKMLYKDALNFVQGKELKYQSTFRMTDEQDYESIVTKKEYVEKQ